MATPTVKLNTAQSRMAVARQGLYAGGLDWDGDVFSDTYIEPVNNVLMLKPTSLSADFHTSNSGDLAKLALSAFTGYTSANWFEAKGQDANDGPYLKSKGSVAEYLITSASWTENQGVCFSLFNYNAGAANAEILEWGINTTADGNAGPSFRIYNGYILYYQDGAFVSRLELRLPKNRQYVDITFLPYRKREILVITSENDAATAVCWHIAEDETSPIIFPSDKLWWSVQEGQAAVQIHKVKFPASGYATTLPGQFGLAPATGATLETWTNDDPAGGITNAKVLADAFGAGCAVTAVGFVQSDGSTPFVANSMARNVRMRVTMTSSGILTPYLYGAQKAYRATFENTDDADELDITPFIMRDNPPTFEVPDDPSGVRFNFTLNLPLQINTTDAPGFLDGSNWPAQFDHGDGVTTDLVTDPVEYEQATDDVGSRARCVARDRWALLEAYQFQERVPFDGMVLSHASSESAVGKVIDIALGTAFPRTLETVTFKIPEMPEGGEPNFAAEVGDSAAQVLDRMQSAFAASFAMGFRPATGGEEFYFLDPDAMSTTPKVTLYATPTEAEAETGDENLSYGDFRSHPLEVEANEVWVTGRNPQTGEAIQAYSRDSAAQDPTTAVASRPTNWSGMIRRMGILEPKVTTQAAAERLLNYIFPIVSARRIAAEWTCLWPVVDGVPVWRWDVVELDGQGSFRVSTISCTMTDAQPETSMGAGDEFVWRMCRMTGIKVGTGTAYGQGGRDLRSMAMAAREAARNKIIKRPGWQSLGKSQPREIILV